MKKYCYYLISAIAALFFVACDKNGLEEKDPFKEPDKSSKLTPDEHKAKLDEVATQFLSYVRAEDYKDVVESLNKLSYYTEDEVIERPVAKAVGAIVQTLDMKNPMYLVDVLPSARDKYIVDLEGLFGSKGVNMSYSKTKGQWTLTHTNDRNVVISYDNSVIEFYYSEEVVTYKYDDLYDELYYVDVPNTMSAALTIDGKKAIELTVSSNLSEDGLTFKPEVRLVVAPLTFKVSADFNPESLSYKSEILHEKESIFSAYTKVAAPGMTDLDNWVVKDTYWDEYYYDPSYQFVDHVKTGEFYIYVLNVKLAGTGDLRAFIDVLMTIEEDEGLSDKQYAEKYAEAFNKHVNVFLTYTDENKFIAKLELQASHYEWEYYDYVWNEKTGSYEEVLVKEVGYEVEPVIVFGDGSRLALYSDEGEDYLENNFFKSTELAFERLIKDFEKLID